MIAPGQLITRADVARHYDELDALYRDVWGDHLHHGLWLERRERPEQAVVNLLEHLVSHLDLDVGASVCDVGSGYGATAAFLADRFGCDVQGVTLSRKQFERAVERGASIRGRISFHHGDFLDSSFRDSQFDAVIAVESLAHMPDKAAFFTEAARILRPGGRLGVCAWLASRSATPLQRKHLLEPICREGKLPSLGTMEEYVHLMRRAGLEPHFVEDLSHRVRRTWRVIARRVAGRIMMDSTYQRLLVDPAFQGRIFGLTVLRLLAAYHLGVMRYGMLIATRPLTDPAA